MSNVIEKVEDYVSSSSVSPEMLMEKLTEFLAVEKGGVKLYETALQIVRDPELQDTVRRFHEQTKKHVTILTRVIRDFGGDPETMTPAAKVATEKGEALLKTMSNPDRLSGKAVEINAIENIVLAETKDHADWELLGKIARRSKDEIIRDILKPAVDEVEPEEDDHLSWAKEQMAKLSFMSLARDGA